jgi:hypothetical protein
VKREDSSPSKRSTILRLGTSQIKIGSLAGSPDRASGDQQTLIVHNQKQNKETKMKEPGLDNRHRDKDGRIQQKRSDALNKNLPEPIPEFSRNATLGRMRRETGKVSVEDVRRVARNRKPKG